MLRILGEAEPGEDARRACRRPMRIDRIEPLMDFADAMRVVRMLGLGHELRALLRRGEHRLERRSRSTRRFLRDIADARA